METVRDDSQIALRIATSSAIITSVLFFIYSALIESAQYFSVSPVLEIFIKSAIVVGVIAFSHKRVEESFLIQNFSQIPFLSTFFFYGITLFLGYASKILYIILQIIFSTHIKFADELSFLTGINSFTGSGILSSFFVRHIPYLVYFLFLKWQLKKGAAMRNSTIR